MTTNPEQGEMMLPCPFCGSAAKTFGHDVHGLMYQSHGCSNKDCAAHSLRWPLGFWNARAPQSRAGVVTGWTPLTERAPDHGCYLFFYPETTVDGCRYGETQCIAFWDSDQRVARGDYHGPADPTHWMPLPERPDLRAALGVGEGEG